MKAAVRLPTPLRTLAQSGSLTKSRFAKSPKRASLMSISLYDLSVPTFLQTVNALAGVLDRAAEHCAKAGHDPDDFVEVRLIDDMAPFHFQIEAAWHHAVWGLEAARTGAFTPPALVGPVPFGDLQGMMEKAKLALEAFEPDEVNGWAGRHWTFRSVLANSPLRLRRSFCRSRCPTSTSTLSRPMTSCGCAAFRLVSVIMKGGCVHVHIS